VMLSHADYGQSDTLGYGGALREAQKDAKETDFVIVYKPMKKTMIKLFHARRTSEYDGVVPNSITPSNEGTQAHTRLVVSQSF
ncbi:MAG: hypothetical protein OQK71_06610, partial [Desulfobacter sp.]|nr:hypothetical protein [Desulfobacter sp.]